MHTASLCQAIEGGEIAAAAAAAASSPSSRRRCSGLVVRVAAHAHHHPQIPAIAFLPPIDASDRSIERRQLLTTSLHTATSRKGSHSKPGAAAFGHHHHGAWIGWLRLRARIRYDVPWRLPNQSVNPSINQSINAHITNHTPLQTTRGSAARGSSTRRRRSTSTWSTARNAT
jgi:hypothetical protein